MNTTDWEQLKSKYKIDQFVQGKVEFHAPYGVFVNLNEPLVKGLIKIPDFLDEGEMKPEMYQLMFDKKKFFLSKHLLPIINDIKIVKKIIKLT